MTRGRGLRRRGIRRRDSDDMGSISHGVWATRQMEETVSKTSLLTVLTGVMLTTTAIMPAVGQEEVILRLLPHHTDAMVENYNPHNPTGPQ